MATLTQGLKFYRFSSSTSSASKITTAKAVEGAIIYIVDLNELWIGGATPQLVLKGANDVTYANNVLTVTHYTNDGGTLTPVTQTLDFSDVASADATLKVFQNVYGLMGASDGTGAAQGTKVLDYSGTNYLSTQTTLVGADKALDAAIKDVVDDIYGKNAIADADTASGTGYATITTTTPTADFKVLNAVQEVQGVLTQGVAYQLKKVAATAESEDLLKTSNSAAVYDIAATEISNTWVQTVQGNILADGDNVDADLNKLDNKIAGLADELIRDEQVINATVSTLQNSIGLQGDLTLDLTGTQIIGSDTNVKAALIDLVDYVTTEAGKVDDVQINGTTIVNNKIANLGVQGTYNASTNKLATESTVEDAIEALDSVADADDTTAQTGHATITTTTPSADFKVLNSITETDGKLTAADAYQLKKLAATGAAEDVSIADAGNHTSETNVEGALQEIYGRVETLEGSFDVIKSVDAATTPAGVTWIDNTDPDNPQTVTGTLVASDRTFHKIYLVPVDNTGTNKYAEYITTKETSGQSTTYGWERLGTIDVDLTGYVKNITLNGKQYAVDNNTVNITLTDVITGVTGETAISGGDTNYVKVAANTVKDSTNGTNVTTLSTTTKIEEVADGLTKDGTATYSDGHYVIENGKLVSAAGKSSGDTYTKSANDGLTTASDVKAYVDDKVNGVVAGLDVAEYAQASVTATSGTTTITVKGIQENDGLISASTSDTTILADGEYNASTNKLATQSTVTNAINALDADITSDDAAVATVEVKQVDGVINDVVVTNVNAGVQYVASQGATPANLTATTQTGAVTGADIATIKQYVDDRSALLWEEYE